MEYYREGLGNRRMTEDQITESSGNVFADLELERPEHLKSLADALLSAGVNDPKVFRACAKISEWSLADRDNLRARIKELEEALRPFAEAAMQDGWDSFASYACGVHKDDWRHAREILNKGKPEAQAVTDVGDVT